MSISNSLLMAKRLKELREEKKLSHLSLSKALKKRYDIDISRDSLMNYEVSDPNHPKAYKNEGMRVEYLRGLADFYGVSADYLLGLSADDGGKRTATAIPICKEISQLFPEKLEEMRKRLSKALDMILYFQQAMKDQKEQPEE